MQKEYGSNFCEELQISGERLEDSDGRLFFDSGRSALRCLLDLPGEDIQRVLLPQYDCESVLEPFVERKYEISYYPVDRYFRPCGEALRRLAAEKKPQLILVQAYFGVDTLAEERAFFAELREKGVIIAEDITHSMFVSGMRECADYRFGSIRKWCALPDGGVLLGARDKLRMRAGRLRENTDFIRERLEAQKRKREYFARGSEGAPKDFIALYDGSEARLDAQKGCYTMSEYTRERLGALDVEELVLSRRRNYGVLAEELADVCGIEAVYPKLSQNAVPLYFPIYVRADRDGLRLRMRQRGIFLPVIWPIPPMLEKTVSEEVGKIYDTVLAVPCDQRYTGEDMRFIADAVRQETEALL
ncbi:MAG: hypothetical protein NC223_00785 [Butyrivibrio sp.]|nr:hypothetical protein [Butyrivibrio sp.]